MINWACPPSRSRGDRETRGIGREIASHQMEAEIEPGGCPGRGQDLPVVDEQDARVRVHLDTSLRVPARRAGGWREQAGCGEHEPEHIEAILTPRPATA